MEPNRLVKINDNVTYEIKYTNRAKALLENLENKEVTKVIGDIVDKFGSVKIETAVNVIYAGVKYSDDGKKINRDDLYDIIPESAIELSRIMGEISGVLLYDCGFTKAKEKEEVSEGK